MKRNISRNDRMNDVEILKMARLIDDFEQSISQNISQYLGQNSNQSITAMNYVHQYYNNPYTTRKYEQIKRNEKVLCNQLIQLNNRFKQNSTHQSGSKLTRLSKKQQISQNNTRCTSAPKRLRQRKSVEIQQGSIKGILKNTSKSQQQITVKPFFLFLENKKKVTFKRPLSQNSNHETKRKKQHLTNSSLFSSPQASMHKKLFFQELSQI